MAGALFGICVVFIILMADEVLWRFKILRGEQSRGLVHIAAGSFVAFWPFFMSMRAIQIIAVLAGIAIAISRRYHIFQSIHAVKRRTYGEYFFPISIAIAAAVTQSPAIFAAVVLHLSLADGLASILGTMFGKRTKYRILGQNKSWVGTGAFFLVSLAIMACLGIRSSDQFVTANVLLFASLPLLATFAESIAVYGTDDLVVPMLVLAVLENLNNLV